MPAYCPILFIGLGKIGEEIAHESYERLKSNHDDVSDIIRCFTLDDEGKVLDYRTNEEQKIEGLNKEYNNSNISSNYKIIESERSMLSEFLVDNLTISPASSADLSDKDIQLDDEMKVFVIFSLFAPIGSIAYLPILNAIRELLQYTLMGTNIDLNLIGLFPDLSGISEESEVIKEFEYCRTFACIREIESINRSDENLIHAYLFSQKNEVGNPIGSYEGLIESFGEFFFNLLEMKINIATKIVSIFAERDTTQGRFMSFGVSKLIFPTDLILEKINSHFICQSLKAINLKSPTNDNPVVLHPEVNSFLSKNRFDQICIDAFLDSDGQSIWVAPVYQVKPGKDAIVDSFLKTTNNDVEKYNDNTWPTLTVKANNNNSIIIEKKMDLISAYVNEKLNNSENLFYCKNFMDVLLGEEMSYLEGDSVVENSQTIYVLKEKIKNFFDVQIEPKRKELKGVQENIKTLEKRLKNLNDKLSELEKDDPQIKIIEKDINKVESELSALADSASVLEEQIEKFDTEIEDANVRKKLLDSIITEIQDNLDEAEKKVQVIDKDYGNKKIEYSNILLRRKKVFYQSYLFTSIGFLISLAILFKFAEILKINYLECLLSSVCAAIAGYGIWFFLKYWRGLRLEIEIAKLSRDELAGSKTSLLNNILHFNTQKIKITFEYVLSGNLLQKVLRFEDKVKTYHAKMSEFIDNMGKLLKNNEDNLLIDTFPKQIYIRSVVSNDDVEQFIEEKRSFFNAKVNIFFTSDEHKLSRYFTEFIKTKDLKCMKDDMVEIVDDIFANLKDKSIEEFLMDKQNADRIDVSDRINSQFKLTKSFIQAIMDAEMDISTTLSFAGINNPYDSKIANILTTTIDNDINVLDNENKEEIYFMKLKVGFPPSYISMYQYARNVYFDPLPEQGKEKYFIESTFISKLKSSETERIIHNGINIQEVVTLGVYVLHEIEEKDSKFYYNRILISEDLENLKEYFKSLAGRKDLEEISKKIAIEKEKSGIITKLANALQNSKLSDVDKRIINELLEI